MRIDAGRRISKEGKQRQGLVERLTGAAKPARTGSGIAPTGAPESESPPEPQKVSRIPDGSNAEFEKGMPRRSALPTWLRRLGCYGLALLLVATGALVRLGLTHLVGPDLAVYIIFYPAVMLAALVGGWGPGLLATLTTAVIVDYWLLPPPGWKMESPVDTVGLVVFTIMGVFMSIVAELYRHTRGHVQELVIRRTVALNQANEHLRERGEELQARSYELTALAQSLEGEKRILQAVMDGARNSHLVYLDRDFNFVRVNKAYARTCGYTPEEMIGKNHFALYPHAGNEAIFARVRDTGVPVEFHDRPFVFPDQPERGTTYWDWTLTPIKSDSGAVEGLVFSLFETTQRRQTEEALRESEEKFKAIFNRAALGLAISDPTGLILDCNLAYQEMLDYRKGELQQKRFLDLTHPDDIRRNRELQRRLNEGVIETYQLEKRYLRRDGRVVWCNLIASAIRNPDGTPKYNIAVAEDITRRKHAEEALRKSEASLAKAQAIAHLANWEVDVRTNQVRGSEELYHLFHLEPEVALDAYIEKFHSEDRHRVVEAIHAAIQEGKPYRIDYRIIPSPGVLRHVHAEGEVTCDKDGRPLTFFGTVQDITEQRKTQEALRELNATLESRVAQRTEELEQRAWQLQKLSLELTEAEERERARIAELLHDDLQQVLAAAKFQVGLLSSRVRNDADAQEIVGQAKDLLVEAITKSRSLSHELSAPALAQSDLGAAFEWLAEQMQEKHGLTVHLETGAGIEVASEPLRILLYKAAQEMLFNAIKHAGVQEARVRLRRQRGRLRLSVSDQGRGFDPTASGFTFGLGLLSVRERIELLGGRLTIRSAPGKGSTFSVVIPESKTAEAAS